MKIAVIGAGFYGATLARLVAEAGHEVMVYEAESSIGGNAKSHFDPRIGTHVSDYGAHIFHTNSDRVWDFVSRFATFNGYRHYVKGWTGTKMVDLPFNLSLFSQVLGITTPAEAHTYFNRLASLQKESYRHDVSTVEGWCLANIGPDLYETVVKDYTEKQWGRACSDLPASIIQRLPIRFTYDNTYFHNAKYQGMPLNGYSNIMEQILNHPSIVVVKDADVGLTNLSLIEKNVDRVFFSGPVDRLFSYEEGVLSYRGLRFEDVLVPKSASQGAPVINNVGRVVPGIARSGSTRTIEHSLFYPEARTENQTRTLLTREYPAQWAPGDRPYYPIRDEQNLALHERYTKLLDHHHPKVRLGGRLGTYMYLDIDQAVGQAMSHAKEFQ